MVLISLVVSISLVRTQFTKLMLFHIAYIIKQISLAIITKQIAVGLYCSVVMFDLSRLVMVL